MSYYFRVLGLTLIALVLFKSCDKAPKYVKPTVATPPAYKEIAPDTFKETNDWKFAHPSDAAIRGKWWEMFNDPQLNGLEEQLNSANQNIALADANLRAARALVKEARSASFPTITTSPSIIVSRQSGAATHSNVSPGRQSVNYTLPFDATWEPDFWGRIRNTVVSSTSEAQASAADLENVRLTVEAELDCVDRNHSVDRHREEERDHDDRFCACSGARGREELARRDLSGVHVAVSADHDDDDGGVARGLAARARHGHRFRA